MDSKKRITVLLDTIKHLRAELRDLEKCYEEVQCDKAGLELLGKCETCNQDIVNPIIKQWNGRKVTYCRFCGYKI